MVDFLNLKILKPSSIYGFKAAYFNFLTEIRLGFINQ